jgi:hypothetical protein
VADVAGTIGSARPVRRRRLVSALTAGLALSLLSPVPASAADVPSRVPAEETGAGNRTATVSITEVSPAVPDDTLTIRGTITNEGDSPIIDSTLDPRLGVPLTTRNAIEDAATRTGFDISLDGSLITGHGQQIERLGPGMSTTFELQVPVSELSLGEDGVYQIGVTLTGQTEAEQWGDQILGAGRTVLPWQPDPGSTETTQLTILWPLISTPHLTAQTGSDVEQTPAFRDEALLEEISPGGRLHEMVALGADLPVTWVIDPDLLASVDAMTEDYQVYTDDGLEAGHGQDEARAWLGALREAVEGDEVVALPFGDPDLASLAHQGRDVPGSLGQLRTATDLAAVTVETTIGVEPSTDFAWPVEGAIDPSIVSVATSAGATNIIARSDSLRPAAGENATLTAARPIGGGISALVADAGLSTLFEGDMTRTAAALQAQQQLLAQTLAITLQEPANQRSIVLAPQRMPTTAQARAMAAALQALSDDAGWVEFTGLSEAARAEPDPRANQQVPAASAYPERLRSQELPTSAFHQMRETQRTLDDFAVILTRQDRVTVPYGNAIRREMSTSWRGDEEAGEEYREELQEDLIALTEQVHLIQKSPITLSGRSATIPITVQNNLVQDVHNLELRLESSRSLGLEVGDEQEVRVNGGHSQSVKFSATSRANGRTTLVAQLYTADGKRYGDPMQFQANVTSITSAVLMVIAGGLLLVVLAGIRMYTQRKRAARRAATAAPDETVSGEESGSDTGPQGSGPAAGSERLDLDD